MFDTGKMKKKVEELKKSGLIRKNEKILIAFSGGPDSVFLYNLLDFLKKEYSLEISLMYINHNLREDVGNDLKFVREFSEENNVPLYIESVNVKEYATENKKSIELAARELRYEAIERTLKNINYDRIATGHNLDDNIETFIFRLVRGTSLKGLKGIPEERGNIIRPILQFEKNEILNCLQENRKSYIIDYTNNENDFTRNFIRNKIFPDFQKINPNFKQKIYTLITEINERENEKLEISEVIETKKKVENNLKEKEQLAQFLKQNNVEISRNKINQIFDSFFYKNGILKNEGSKEIYLGKDKFLQNQYGKLKIIENRNEKSKIQNINNSFEKLEILKKNQRIEWYNYKIVLYENIRDYKAHFVNERDVNYTFFKFADNIEKYDRIIVRNRRDGDKIFVKNLGHKKVKKILIDEKISKWERDLIPIIEIETSENQVYLGNFENKKIEIEKSIFDFPIGAKDIKIKEILTVSDIKFSKFLEKIYNNEIEKLENTSKLLIIGRKNGRER